MKKIHKIIISAILLIGVSIATYAFTGTKKTEAKSPYSQITDKELIKRLEDKKETVVYFYKKDCKYCKQANPLLKETISNNNVKVYQLDFDKYEEVTTKLNVYGTPIIVWYKDGQEISRLEGVKTLDIYNRWFKAMLEQ